MADQPISPIPPGPDGGCPIGYALNPADNMCYLVGPPITNTTQGVNWPDVDPRNQAKLAGLGTQDSGFIETFVVEFWHQMLKNVTRDIRECGINLPKPVDTFISAGASIFALFLDGYDYLVCLGVAFLGNSATRNIPTFWGLIGGLITDILGVEVKGDQIYQDLQARGTLAAMQDVGANLVNLLVGEFTGTISGRGGLVEFTSRVDEATALPVATLTPAGGVKAAQALMGFVLSSAVRQGNMIAVGKQLPFRIGAHLEAFAEAMRTNLGIGRMLRFALRPIFQDLVATPLKWAVNKEYRPKLLIAPEAARRRWAAETDNAAYLEECALDGYSEARALALLTQHTRKPDVKELLTMVGAHALDDATYRALMGGLGFDPTGADFIKQASDFEPVRRVSLAILEHYLLAYARGDITGQALTSFVEGLKTGGLFLSDGEIAAAESLQKAITGAVKLRPRHLSPGQLRQAYIDGTITLQEYEDHLAALGYSADDVQTLGIEVLIAAKNHAAAAAKHAAAGKKGGGPKPATPATPAPSGGTPAAP